MTRCPIDVTNSEEIGHQYLAAMMGEILAGKLKGLVINFSSVIVIKKG